MQDTVRQHYVPRTYLKAWVTANGRVSVKDRVSGKDFSSSPDNVCVERFYYEADPAQPDNMIEHMFQPFETQYAPHAAHLNAIVASGSDAAQVTAALAAAATDVSLDAAIKGLAAVAYFRTPAALEALQNELKRDKSDAAQSAARETQTPHDMAQSAFDSTLLERFQGLVPTYLHTTSRLITCDRVCLPLQGASLPSGGSFGWAIGRDPEMHALMPIGPNLVVVLSMLVSGVKPGARAMPQPMYDQSSQLVLDNALRFLIL